MTSITKMSRSEVLEAADRAAWEARGLHTQARIRREMADAVRTRSAKHRHLDTARCLERRARVFEVLSEAAFEHAKCLAEPEVATSASPAPAVGGAR